MHRSEGYVGVKWNWREIGTDLFSLFFFSIDKAMAMGIIQFAIGLFGNVPCPIIYGAVVDYACLVWDTICDKTGACSLYNGELFRQFFLGKFEG